MACPLTRDLRLVLGDCQADLNLSCSVSHKDYGVLGTFQGHSISIGLANVLFLVYESSWCETKQLKLGFRARCQAVPQCLQRSRAADGDKWRSLETKRLNLSGTGNARRISANWKVGFFWNWNENRETWKFHMKWNCWERECIQH